MGERLTWQLFNHQSRKLVNIVMTIPLAAWNFRTDCALIKLEHHIPTLDLLEMMTTLRKKVTTKTINTMGTTPKIVTSKLGKFVIYWKMVFIIFFHSCHIDQTIEQQDASSWGEHYYLCYPLFHSFFFRPTIASLCCSSFCCRYGSNNSEERNTNVQNLHGGAFSRRKESVLYFCDTKGDELELFHSISWVSDDPLFTVFANVTIQWCWATTV